MEAEGRPTRVRWIGLSLVFLMTLISNMDRSNVSVSTSTIIKAIHINAIEMGVITSVFSLAYAAMQVPSSLMVMKVGTRKGIAVAVLLWSIFTVLTGFSGGFMSLLIIRMVFGFSEAPLYPGLNKFVGSWFPLKERAFANSAPNAGAWLASIITPPLAVWILLRLGLHWIFVLSGVIGCVGAALWYILTRDAPSQHPGVNTYERQYIQSNLSTPMISPSSNVPWRAFFSSPSFWGICLTYFCSVYLLQYFNYWLPLFLQVQLHMSLKSMGFAASIPWIFIFIATLSIGRISDWLVKSKCSLFVSRNCLILVGFVGSAIVMYISTLMSNPWIVVILLSTALGFIGFNMTIPWAVASDIGGEHTGVVSSFMNTFGQVGAAIMATVSAYVGTHFGWNYTLLTLVVVAFFGIVMTLLIRPQKALGIDVKVDELNL